MLFYSCAAREDDQGEQTVLIKEAMRKCALQEEEFYRNLKHGLRLKAEKIRPKIPENMDQEKFYAIDVHA